MNSAPVLAFITNIGPMEWLVILIVMLLLFGRRLPEVGKSLGKGIVEFKKGLKDVEDAATQAPPPPASHAQQAPAQWNQQWAQQGPGSPGWNQPPALPPQQPAHPAGPHLPPPQQQMPMTAAPAIGQPGTVSRADGI